MGIFRNYKNAFSRLLIICGFFGLSMLLLSYIVNVGESQAQTSQGSVTLSLTRLDQKALKADVFLEVNLYFKTGQSFNWFLMNLAHVSNNRLEEVTNVNLTRDVFDLDSRHYQGTVELSFELNPSNMYPLDEYNMTLILYDQSYFNHTMIEKPYLAFDLSDQLRLLWNEKNEVPPDITAIKELLPDGQDVVYFSLVIDRQPQILFSLLAPVFLSFLILFLTIFLDTNRRDWLSIRTTVYVSLFIFTFTFQNIILANAPLRVGISPVELILYLMAIDTVVLFLMSVTKSSFGQSPKGSNVKSHLKKNFLKLDIIGLFVVSLVSAATFYYSIGMKVFQIPLLSAVFFFLLVTPLLVAALITRLEVKRSTDLIYLSDYVGSAISEHLVTNSIQGINYLINLAKNSIPNYAKDPSKFDTVLAFLDSTLIANVNQTQIRDAVLRGYEDLFITGAEGSSIVPFIVTAHHRTLSMQVVKRENAFASIALLHSLYRLFMTSLEKFKISMINDANTTYCAVSADIIIERITTLYVSSTMFAGAILYETTEREELDDISLQLLDLLERFLTKSIETDEPELISMVHGHVQQDLNLIREHIERRERLIRRVEELSKKLRLT